MLLEWLFGKPCKTHFVPVHHMVSLSGLAQFVKSLIILTKSQGPNLVPWEMGLELSITIGVYFNSIEPMMEIVNQLSNCDPLG